MAWDSDSPKQQASVQARALKVQLVDAVGPFSPFWRDRFTALGRTAAQAATVEADTRPTMFVFAGPGDAFPDREHPRRPRRRRPRGARLWTVLGLTRSDALVAALPLLPTASLQALQLAALGAGSPALFPGDDPDEVAQALRLVPATVLALPSASACVRSAPRWSAAATLPTDGL